MGIAQTGLTDKTAVWLLTEADIRLGLGWLCAPTGGIHSVATTPHGPTPFPLDPPCSTAAPPCPAAATISSRQLWSAFSAAAQLSLVSNFAALVSFPSILDASVAYICFPPVSRRFPADLKSEKRGEVRVD